MKVRPVNQHYVSAAYLRGFVPDGERALFVRRRAKKTWFRQVPERIATRQNFYSVLRDDGQWDDSLEHLLAQHIEGPGIRALDALLTRRDVPSLISRHRIAVLVAMQYLRIPQLRSDIDLTLQEYLQGFAEQVFADPNRAAIELQRRQGLNPSESKRVAQEARDAFASGGIELKVRREAALPYIFGLLEDGAAVMERYEWLELISKPCVK